MKKYEPTVCLSDSTAEMGSEEGAVTREQSVTIKCYTKCSIRSPEAMKLKRLSAPTSAHGEFTTCTWSELV